jgi:hypothetical protein
MSRSPCAGQLLRVLRIDSTTCPHRGGRLRWIADGTELGVMCKILLHLQSRAPPRRGVDDAGSPAQAPTSLSLADKFCPGALTVAPSFGQRQTLGWVCGNRP